MLPVLLIINLISIIDIFNSIEEEDGLLFSR